MRPAVLTLSFGVVVLAAKATTWMLRVADGGGAGLRTVWAPVAVFAEDLWVIALFGALIVITDHATRRSLRVRGWAGVAWWLIYAAGSGYVALNIPVARVFSTPTTYAFVHGAGGALADSVVPYLTLVNLGVPAILIVVALLLPRWIRPPATRVFWGPIVGLVTLALILAPRAGRSVTSLGLHRNALAAIVTTTLAHHVSWRSPPPSGADPSLPLVAAGAADDLTPLLGTAAGRNVVWIILESTGARHLSLYGGVRETTPFLSALAHEALVFDHAYTAYPESIKGLFAMLCAQRPDANTPTERYAADRHGCTAIAAVLRAAGYRTGLFHSGRFAYLGMEDIVRQRGFDRLEDAATIGGRFASSFGVDDAATVQKLLAFVDAGGSDQPFFALYMPIAGHHPYRMPGDGPRPFPERGPLDAYHNDLFAGDAALGRLRTGLAARGLDRRTLYVVVGDHGEAFYEHEGNFAHTLFLYEENVRVPLLFAAPGLFQGTRRAPQLASVVDIAPTLLALLGVPVPADHRGQSLLLDRPKLVPFFTDQGVWQVGLREGPWKFIHDVDAGRSQLFDLRSDPSEQKNLAALFPDRTARYLAYLTKLPKW